MTGTELATKLQALGISKSEAARRTGLSRQTVYDLLERKNNLLTPKAEAKFAEFFRSVAYTVREAS